MSELLQSFLDNDSFFGRIMPRIGMIIGANLMYVLFSMPVFTVGAAFTALYHVMLKILRGDGTLNPFREFWHGFRSNFKQATLYWCALLVMLVLGYVDVRFCDHMGGILTFFQYGIYALGLAALIIMLYLFPVMAAFESTLDKTACALIDRFYLRVLIPLKTVKNQLRGATGGSAAHPVNTLNRSNR